jgi:cytochrome c oxidase subunit 2
VPQLVLPVGSTVQFQIQSRDVAHSFWVVDFLEKIDAYPHRANLMTVHTSREGTFAGKCAEFCGDYHAQMLFTVKVVSKAAYQSYVQSLRSQGFTGRLGPNYDRTPQLLRDQAPSQESQVK